MKTESSKMQVKKYVAQDMRQALKLVREELGPEAVILSNRRIPGGVEILTTLEYDEKPFAQPQDGVFAIPRAVMNKTSQQRPPEHSASSESQTAEHSQNQLDSAFEALLNQHMQTHPAKTVDEDLMAAMRSEIENLRLLLKDQMEHMTRENWSARNPVEAAVMQRFEDHRVSGKVARPIAHQVAQYATIDEGWRAAIATLRENIPIADSGQFNQGVVALLGPTGAGKTTTIAKLAVRYAMRYNRDELALVTTDRYRLAAYEQLKALGRIIDVPVRLVDEKTSLNKVLRSLRDKSLVLIDTAGFQHEDEERRHQLEALDNADVEIKKLLLLPCTSQESALRAAYDLLERSHIDACILSKTDETMSFGEVMSLVVEKALPVAYITNGQSIPDDLESGNAGRLIRLLFEKQKMADTRVPEMTKTVHPMPTSRVYAGT